MSYYKRTLVWESDHHISEAVKLLEIIFDKLAKTCLQGNEMVLQDVADSRAKMVAEYMNPKVEEVIRGKV